MSDQVKKPFGRKLFSPDPDKSKGKVNEGEPPKEEDSVIDNFDSGSMENFDVIGKMVSVLPREYGCVIEVSEPADCEEEEMERHEPMCYFVMNNGCIEEYNEFFERPDGGIKNHLKPLFIRVKVEDITMNKILVDGWDGVNLMPHLLLIKVGKHDTNLRPHNSVRSNYEVKTRNTMGVNQIDVTVLSRSM